MGTFIDLTGQRFNKLLVVERVENDPRRGAKWKCLCDCGNYTTIDANHLKGSNTKSCGCLSTFIDLTGQKFNRLLVIERIKNSRGGQARWKCLCDCGKYTMVCGGDLKNDHIKSCGCLKRKYDKNVRYFEKIDTKEKAYILGFIYGDGCVNKYGLHFGQNSQDREILEYIKKCLGYTGPIYYDQPRIDKRTGKIRYADQLQIYSKDLAKNLTSCGAVQRKSLILEAPSIEQELTGSFIRGYLDADGSVGLYKIGNRKQPVIAFYGTFKLLSWIQSNTENRSIYPNRNIYQLQYTSRKSITSLMELINESPFGLTRKTKKLDEIVAYLEKADERKRIGIEKHIKTCRQRRLHKQAIN